jgi:hypothetical protein
MDDPSSNWLTSFSKQLFILTSAGKPVFSLHDSFGTNGLAICALIRAISAKTLDRLEIIHGKENLKIIFVYKSELLLVCSSIPGATLGDEGDMEDSEQESVQFIQSQLELLYLHILFHVTKPALVNLFAKNSAYDLSTLLGGTEVEARNLIEFSEHELTLMLDAIPTVTLPIEMRLSILEALDQCRENLAPFAFLINKDGMLIAGCGPRRPQNYRKSKFGPMLPYSKNFLLLANFIRSTPQLLSTQMWTPLCFPLFDDSGHFQVYCSSVSADDDSEQLFLLLLTTDQSLENFHECSRRRDIFKSKINVESIITKISRSQLSCEDIFEHSPTNKVFHMVIRAATKDEHSTQYVESKKSPSFACPIDLHVSPKGRRYLVRRYSNLRLQAESDASFRMIVDAKPRDSAFFYREAELEIMGLFPPLATQAEMVQALAKIKAYVQKNKQHLFCFPQTL